MTWSSLAGMLATGLLVILLVMVAIKGDSGG